MSAFVQYAADVTSQLGTGMSAFIHITSQPRPCSVLTFTERAESPNTNCTVTDREKEEHTNTDVTFDATQVLHPEQTGFLKGAVKFEPKFRFQYTHCICTSPYTS
jgi:hypothetical protein